MTARTRPCSARCCVVPSALPTASRSSAALPRVVHLIFLPFTNWRGSLAKAGEREEAITIIEAGLALAPNDVDLKLSLGRLLHGNGDSRKGAGRAYPAR